MATLDALTLHVLVGELGRKLIGGRVDKVTQPDKDEINILIRSGGENHRLLISACPDSCRLQLTQIKKQSPIEAPMFCMLLRKYLSGGRIVSITQPDTDRIVRIEIESTDELYNTDRFYLIAEIMGRHSNIILVDSQEKVLDCIKRMGIGAARMLMPNVKYTLPPTAKKKNPLTATEADIMEIIKDGGKVEKLLTGNFYAMAPAIVLGITERAALPDYIETQGDKATLAKVMYAIMDEVKSTESAFLTKINGKDFFLPFKPLEWSFLEYDSPSRMLEEYYTERDRREFMRRRSASLIHSVEQRLNRAMKKLAAFDLAIAGEGDYDRYRVYGELLLANIYRMAVGMKSIVVENYYEQPPKQIEIELDPALPPMRNSQRYFKLYKKAKGARDTALAMREGTCHTIEYLSGVLDYIKRADSIESLEEIRGELEDGKYIRQEKKDKKRKQKKQPPLKYISVDGYEIYVGRNNYQNDELTFRMASAYDLWLHTKDRPGSHTVIVRKGKEDIPDTTIEQAAALAAYHSSAGDSGAKVEVDYTLCKYVKKPAGALPGKVIYTNQRTVMIEPKRDES